MALDGTGEYIEESANSWLSTVTLPLDFSLQFEYLDNILLVDLDLPEIEDIPQEKAARLANGTVKKKSKTQKDLKSDYLRCVFGLAVFFSANLFNISPAIKRIVISGYTQRRNPKTGDLQDDYIYSVKFLRDVFETTNISSIDPYDFCMQFENRCNITQTMLMKAITPFAC